MCHVRGACVTWLVIPLLLPSEAKFQASSVSLGQEQRWGYISKFGYSPGKGTYSLRIRAKGRFQNVDLQLETYLDEDWDTVLNMKDPCERKTKARKSGSIPIPGDGQWSKQFNGLVKNSVRSHVWYFALVECGGVLQESVDFEYEISQLNEESHFSVETRWTLPSHIVSLLGFFLFVILFAKRCFTEMSSVGGLHAVIWALAAVIAMQLLAQSLTALHLWRYSYNGIGVKTIEATAEIMFILSHLVQSTLLILIGYGYALIPVDVEPGTVLLIFSLSAVIHIILVLCTKVEDSADKFHDYDGLAGKMLLGFRFAAFAIFLWCLKDNISGAPFRLRTLLVKFGFIGTLYFVGHPCLVLLSSVFAPYWRPPLLTPSLAALQIGTAWWLHKLFLSRGEFFEVSELNSSSLPGGTPRSPSDSPKRFSPKRFPKID